MISGALLYIAMRWFDRLIGVASTIVLARLLAPDDFGVVAIASIVIGLATVLLDFGIHVAVVQRPHLDRADIDTAWTLRLVQSAIISVALVLAAKFVAIHYQDPRLEPVMIVLALAYLLDGLTGMGPVIFQKQQQYAREVAFFMIRRAGGFVVTMLLAVWLRDYWALVIGTMSSSGLGVVLSYAMHRVAPRLTLVRWRHFVGASFWLTLHSIAGYTSVQLDKLIVGRRNGIAMLGAYSIADQISAMPTSELLAPINRALFPAMAAMQADAPRLRQLFLSALGIQATLALPAAIGLALVAGDVVSVMLGEKWGAAVPIMAALALAYGVNAVTHASIYLLNSLAKYKALALLRCGVVIAFALSILVVFPSSGAVQIAWFRAGIAALTVGVVAWLTIRHLPVVSVADMAKVTLRPALATIVMAMSVAWVESIAVGIPSWQRLAIAVATGAATYAVSLMVLWRLAGRPAGAEQWVLDKYRSTRLSFCHG